MKPIDISTPDPVLLLRCAAILNVPVQFVFIEEVTPEKIAGFRVAASGRAINFTVTADQYHGATPGHERKN